MTSSRSSSAAGTAPGLQRRGRRRCERGVRRRALLGGLLLLTACGGSTSSGQENPCPSPNSTYLATYTNRAPELAGACGSLAPFVLNESNGYGTTLPAHTTCASQTETGSPPAMCVIHLDCTTTGKTLTITDTDDFTWSPDGGGGTGVATQKIVSSMGGGCTSTYDVKITRQ